MDKWKKLTLFLLSTLMTASLATAGVACGEKEANNSSVSQSDSQTDSSDEQTSSSDETSSDETSSDETSSDDSSSDETSSDDSSSGDEEPPVDDPTFEELLNEKLAMIPEIEEMTDEQATLTAVMDYLAFLKNNATEEALEKYSEPRKISIYKEYFQGDVIVLDELITTVDSNAFDDTVNGLALTGSETNEYYFTLPAIPYEMYSRVATIAYLGQANIADGYTFTAYGKTLVNKQQKSWFWVEVITDQSGAYLSIYDTDLTYGETVALPDAVVKGEEGLTFTINTAGAWDWMKFRQDGSVGADNCVGTLIPFEQTAEVHKVEYSYFDGLSTKTITQYYLDGETLNVPEVTLSYTDEVGTHTFSGWGETATTVTEDATYTAQYTTAYKEFTVYFLDAEYNEFEVQNGYHYGDTVNLPETTPEKEKEGYWAYTFEGWYVGDTRLVEGEYQITKNIEVEPRYAKKYDGSAYVITIESEGMETVSYNIPMLEELQAEAIAMIPVSLEKSGYTFKGYANKADGETVDLATLTVVSDMTLVAVWEDAYVAMAASLPASVAEIEDSDKTYEDLVAYLTYVAKNPVDDYQEPANVTALKAHYSATRTIYAYTSTSDANVSTSARFEKVEAKTDTWYQDDQCVPYGGFIQATFDIADGEGYVLLPKISYAIYGEVSFSLWGFSDTTAVRFSVNGSNYVTMDNAGTIFYVVEIHGKNLEIHNMNGVDTLLTVTLTDEQYKGEEGLKFTFQESGWSCIQLSHILGTLADETVSPDTPTTPDESVTAEKLLAKLPASTENVANETYNDLVAYLSYVAKNPADDYQEPANVTALKAYYAGNRVIASKLITSVTTNGGNDAVNGLILTGAADNTYTFTLPKICYAIYDEVSCITMFGQANSGYTISAYGTTFVNTSNAWNWVMVVKVGAEGKTVKDTNTGADITLEEGYYLTIGSTDVGAEWYIYVKLSKAVIYGEEGLAFTVKTSNGAWDWMKFRQNGSVETDNLMGTLA